MRLAVSAVVLTALTFGRLRKWAPARFFCFGADYRQFTDRDRPGAVHAQARVWELAEPRRPGGGARAGRRRSTARRAGGSVLRLLIDRPDGRRHASTSWRAMSRELGDVLDAHDAVPGRYHLECSSPGINRPLSQAGALPRVRSASACACAPATRSTVARQFHGVAGRRRRRRRRRSTTPTHGRRRSAAAPRSSAPTSSTTSPGRRCAARARVRTQEEPMLPDLNRVIEQVSKEKGIDRQIIVEALEEAMLSAAQADVRPRQADRGEVQPRDRRGRAVRDQDGRRRTSTTPRTRSPLDEARAQARPRGRGRRRAARQAARREVRPHRRAGGEAEHHPAACATPSATSSTTSSRTGRASSSPASCSASRRRTSSSTSAAPTRSCPRRSRSRASAIARATASAPSSSTSS